jgi:hypothetical protein
VHRLKQLPGKAATGMRSEYADHVEMVVRGLDDELAGGFAEGFITLPLHRTELPPERFAPD